MVKEKVEEDLVAKDKVEMKTEIDPARETPKPTIEADRLARVTAAKAEEERLARMTAAKAEVDLLTRVKAAKVEEERLAKMIERLAKDEVEMKAAIGPARETPEATTETTPETPEPAIETTKTPESTPETQLATSDMIIEAKIAALSDVKDAQVLVHQLHCSPELFPGYARDFVFGTVTVHIYVIDCLLALRSCLAAI